MQEFNFKDLSIVIRDEKNIVAGFRFLCDALIYVTSLVAVGASDNYKVYIIVNECACLCYTCEEFLDCLDEEFYNARIRIIRLCYISR